MVLRSQYPERSLLQRRNSLSNAFQALLDGFLIVTLTVVLSLLYQGVLTTQYMIMVVVLLGLMAVVYDRFGIYRLHGGMTKKLLTLGKAWSIAFSLLFLLAFLTKSTDLFSRVIVSLLYVLGYLFQVAGHIGFRYLQRINLARQEQLKALVIGTGELASHIFDKINSNPWLNESVVGAVTLNGETASDMHTDQLPVLGSVEQIGQLIEEKKIRTVYIAVPLDESPLIKDIYHDLLDANVNIHWAPNIFALNLINHSVKELSGIPILTLSETPLIGTHLLSKAIEDKLVATVALILLSPILLITAVAIKLDSPGPVFFRQARTGWDGREFKIWKFRSMRADLQEDANVVQATRDDSRVTKVGRFIRKTSIDELPQLLNVLAGQMSLVGPRPHAVQHNIEYSKRIIDYLSRHRIKPGITGLAQIRGFRGETKELSQMEKRVQCDLEYINNWSIGLDLSIMVRTLFTLFSKHAY
ncbi:MAG: undecaprenyl-phosphate glucose phosphotransferase [Gammaproteobacteria bacterium]|nr:undecaprenyl-phosphate glucose phosphotransferase [Gammaproteobacteria bacterium]MCB1902921.1 undecaprenyl-phosphate glucose phosphotransferase [Gammaproteobacteria bacterium]